MSDAYAERLFRDQGFLLANTFCLIDLTIEGFELIVHGIFRPLGWLILLGACTFIRWFHHSVAMPLPRKD